MRKGIIHINNLLFLALACFGGKCLAQSTFSKLIDFNQSGDGGIGIKIKPDGNYFVTCFSVGKPYFEYANSNMIISANGDTVLARHSITTVNAQYYLGTPGNLVQLGSDYVSPYSYYLTRGAAGMIKYDSMGDTIFCRTHTDTMKHNESSEFITVLPDSSFLIAGQRDSIGDSRGRTSWGFIRHLSASGELIWTRTYLIDILVGINRFTSIQSLANNRILVGGCYIWSTRIQNLLFNFRRPWFLILDTSGNVLKSTLYDSTYVGGGNVRKDINGGYYHWGGKDSLPRLYPTSIRKQGNWPSYVAHLDSNFQMTWRLPILNFPASFNDIWQVIQAKDGGYVVIGTQVDSSGRVQGSVIRLDRHGVKKWTHIYYVDSNQQAYLINGEERSEGGFVLVGFTRSCATCSQDVWLLSIDSNGCELQGCDNGLAVPRVLNSPSAFAIYPNPTSGSFTINISHAGQLSIYDLLGKRISVYALQAGKSTLQLSGTLSAGVYVGLYQSAGGKLSQITRIIYQP